MLSQIKVVVMRKLTKQRVIKSSIQTSSANELEENNRWHLDALSLLSALLETYQKLSHGCSTQIIVETLPFIQKLTDCQALAYFSIKPDGFGYGPDLITDEKYREKFEKDFKVLNQRDDFATLLQSQIPLVLRCEGRTLVMVALITPSRLRGVFFAYIDGVRHFQEHHKKGLHAIVQNCAYALESHELNHVIKGQNEHLIKSYVYRTAELKEQHKFDRLTRLPNRQYVQASLQHCVERAQLTHKKLAIVLLNLDLFSLVNESLGHHAGDSLLQTVSQRLTQSLHKIHAQNTRLHSAYTLCHFGGDEFCILLSDLDHVDQISHLMMQLSLDLAKPYQYDGQEIIQTFSAGISVFPEHANKPEELLAYANTALNQSKRKGRNQYCIYLPNKNERAVDQLILSRKLHKALDEHEFVLYFQPQFNVLTGEITGFEALIRWPMADGSMCPPDLFIPLAEDLGLIVAIGKWVIEEACRQLRTLRDAGFGNIPVAINIAAQHFCSEDFIKTLTSSICQYNIPAHLVELELTERIVMAEKEALITLKALRNLGFKIAIDDFGTGYSSLSYLKNFPVDCLKIDKSFIADIPEDKGSKAIVTAITQLAKDIGLVVIAEGVERPEQLEFIRTIGCVEAQGYYFSKPLSAEDTLCFLQNRL